MSKCPYCGASFNKKRFAVDHIEKKHGDELSEAGMDACQALYFAQHQRLTGTCMNCGKPTEWNVKTGKPFKVCSDPKCREQLRETFRVNMTRTYGTDNLLTDMEHQREMQSNRRISGMYQFRDGGKVEYMGKLDQNFLKFCDVVLDFKSQMIIEPPEYIPYYDEKTGTTRTYMPDHYLPDYNLMVEIKDGGDHPNGNQAFNDTTKYKVAYKDKAMREQNKYNYIRISGTNYGPFLETLYKIVHEQEDDNKPRNAVIVITESACCEFDDNVDFSTDNEKIDPDRITLIVGYLPNSDTPAYVAISDSKILSNWIVSDYENQLIRSAAYDDPIFKEGGYEIYKYVGRAEDMQAVFPLIVNYAADVEALHEWDIIKILGISNIFFDNGRHGGSLCNNNNRHCDFVLMDRYFVTNLSNGDEDE